MVLFPEELKISRSLGKRLRGAHFELALDRDFEAVIRACAAPRRSGPETWLHPEMILAYGELHRLGLAHSVEAWHAGTLVGGLYGLHLGGVFFGESMFSLERDASKVALARLVEECRARDIRLIDCQVASEHLASLGAREIARSEFAAMLRRFARRTPRGSWARDVTRAG
jgi:leucyl/phenylalanyl-tRNA--protein transferase